MKPKMTPSVDQEKALDEVIQFIIDDNENEIAIAGSAGTGKTVLTKFILERARDMGLLKLLTGFEIERDVYLTSTTNKAAKVLSEATGEEAITIHSLFGLRVINDYKTGKTFLQKTDKSAVIQNAVIILDEASMCNSELLKIIREMTYKCKIIYIGDEYQLAPVKENHCPVFSEIKNQVKLTHIQRQVEGSPIIEFAEQFRNALTTGIFPKIESQGNAVQWMSGSGFQVKINEHFQNMSHPDSARVVAWTNDRVHAYNEYIRAFHYIDPQPHVGELLLTNQPIFGGGRIALSIDKISQVTDSWEDTKDNIDGWMVELNGGIQVFQPRDRNQVKQYMKKLAGAKDWHTYFAVKEGFADLRPIYSNTINKSQGSTYDTVFIDVSNVGKNRKNTELARLMYVAITRAANQVYMTGNLPERVRG